MLLGSMTVTISNIHLSVIAESGVTDRNLSEKIHDLTQEEKSPSY